METTFVLHADGLVYGTPSDKICLHLGFPDPLALNRLALQTPLNDVGRDLQYAEEAGAPALRGLLAGTYQKPVQASDVLVTHGSSEGLQIVSHELAEPGQVILVEEPTYLWAIRRFRLAHLQCISVATDEFGLIPAALRTTLSH